MFRSVRVLVCNNAFSCYAPVVRQYGSGSERHRSALWDGIAASHARATGPSLFCRLSLGSALWLCPSVGGAGASLGSRTIEAPRFAPALYGSTTERRGPSSGVRLARKQLGSA